MSTAPTAAVSTSCVCWALNSQSPGHVATEHSTTQRTRTTLKKFCKFLPFLQHRRKDKGRTASLCQSLSKSLKPQLRYGDFAIFQDGDRRHLGFLKFQIFNSRDAQEGRTAPSCQILSKSPEPRLRYRDFSIFPRWRPSAILDL